jgi:glycosyltransferase involved in cell wall biosynthesis
MDDRLYIIIPFYNAVVTIERTLRSLAVISVPNRHAVTVIGIDDGSTDESAELFERTVRTIAGIRHTLIRKRNGGSGSARNAGLETITGGWVFFLDADDELQFDPVPYMNGAAGYTCLAFTIRFWKRDKPRGKLRPVLITPGKFLDVFTSRNPFQPSNLLFRRECLDSLFDPRFLFLEDWPFWINNPRVFERMQVFRKVMSARVHSHGLNKTSDRVKHGTYRTLVAETLLAERGDALTPRQRQNLRIQSSIGLIQQGKKIPLRTFFEVPCSASLYGKLIVYYLLGDLMAKIDLYGK